MVSKTGKYALRAAVYLARSHREGEEWVRIDDIAEALDVPRNYLSKVLHGLGRAGVLESARGPGGGFRLTRDPATVTLGSVVGALDEWAEGVMPCVLREGPCTPDTPCVAHHRWSAVASEVRDFFGETTLLEILEGATHPEVWI